MESLLEFGERIDPGVVRSPEIRTRHVHDDALGRYHSLKLQAMDAIFALVKGALAVLRPTGHQSPDERREGWVGGGWEGGRNGGGREGEG